MKHQTHNRLNPSMVLLSFFLGMAAGVFTSGSAKRVRTPGRAPELDVCDDGLADLRAAQAEMESVLQNCIVRCMADPNEHPDQAYKLSEAQRAWASFLEAHMAAVYPEDRELGAAAELRKAEVRSELIRLRTRQLRDWWE